jgi:hypothetical protein
MLKKCQNGGRDPWGSTLWWTWGRVLGIVSWELLWNLCKTVKMVKSILEDCRWVQRGALGILRWKLRSKMLKKCCSGEKDPWGSSLRWTCGSLASSDENYTHQCWKSVKIIKRILEDPHWLEHRDLGDHHIRTALKKGENVSKWWQGFLWILTLLGLGHWRSSAENSSVPVKIPVNPHRVGLEGHGDHQLRVAVKINQKVSNWWEGFLWILTWLNFQISGIIK